MSNASEDQFDSLTEADMEELDALKEEQSEGLVLPDWKIVLDHKNQLDTQTLVDSIMQHPRWNNYGLELKRRAAELYAQRLSDKLANSDDLETEIWFAKHTNGVRFHLTICELMNESDKAKAPRYEDLVKAGK